MIEPNAASWAAQRANDNDLAAIENACNAMQSNLDKSDAFVLADAGFHQAVLKAAHNEFLTALESVIFTSLLGSIRLTNFDPERNRLSVPLHNAVFQAIQQRDPDEARSCMLALLNDAEHRLDTLFHH